MAALMRMRIEHVVFARKMAKSVRSKRRQKVLSVRREKYREREKKKLWEKHLAIQAQRTVDMVEVEGEEFLENVLRYMYHNFFYVVWAIPLKPLVCLNIERPYQWCELPLLCKHTKIFSLDKLYKFYVAPEAEGAQPEQKDSTQGEPDAMDTGTKKLSNSQLKKIREQWSSSRRKKRKAKKLGGKKAHARW